ncbi:MAG: preprotein translocase subunit SecA [Bacteriovoracaceae bacterium]|nr:preprotein translocase subunit SecA [Bacteriovoracaceae bacterium]
MFYQIMRTVFGNKQDRDVRSLKKVVDVINQWEPKIQSLSDEELKNKTPSFRARFKAGESLDQLLPEAFAVVREASKRVLGMRHFDVQLMGGLVLHQGKISEMKTGEGKTLTATLALYLNALTGKGAHLVTVNDYLAKRDGEEMGALYQWLGLTVGTIVHDLDDEERKVAYAADITYGTNNEFAFDYLRDNMKFDLDHYVQRPHHFCIVDEVDSILIDEARTPLLISGPSEGDVELYYKIDKVIPKLTKETHYLVDEKHHSAVLTDDGIHKVQEILRIDNLFDPAHIEVVHHVNQSLKAHTLYQKDVNYVVKDDQIIIVDEFTGRLKQGSRWSDGLHQAVEAKENVKIKKENQTLASITFQNYFRLYEKLSGMTGTADTEAEEFKKIYNLDVVVIPTNLPMVRDDEADVIYATKKAKYLAAAEMIALAHEKGQPVLVGTISIESSEILSGYLSAKKIPHEVLNAKQHEREAHIIAQAGTKGAVTIATNMAGRGTDIKLTPETKLLGGLFILGTERHEARRIDNQLRGRSGRQGDPGRSKFFLSLEDDLMRIFGSDRIKKIMITMGLKEDEPIEHRMISNAIAKAQKKVEAHNFDIRKHLLDYDNVMNEQRKVIYRIRREILNDDGNQDLIGAFQEDVALQIQEEYVPAPNTPVMEWDWPALTTTVADVYAIPKEELEKKLSGEIVLNQFKGELNTALVDISSKTLKAKFEQYDPEQVRLSSKEVLLSTFDSHWKDHLLMMDHMKDGIGLRSYGQKDPLVEYKREAFHLFESMRSRIKRSVIETLFSIRLYTQAEIDEIKRRQQEMMDKQLEAHRRQLEEAAKRKDQAEKKAQSPAGPIKRQLAHVKQNDPCPCGSGKKYKHCHGA